MSDKKENKFFSEIKNQIIAGVGLVIAAGFGIFITNMQGWFKPKPEPSPVVVQDSIPAQPQIIINNIVEKKDEPKVIIKEVEKKEDEITW
jgi:hypothetical protein|tara:strand:+ start:684 stop:953 length:270 start_codon:yes stop_codon:yes gene_type:complete